ncbi:phenol hydroxylase [Legionella beliardensis]|uniref:Phenol hydroxylase n=1 Tax=Legionella beliardensis TaxID=91822 RepID=A0A378I0C3_9GAMM|nr:FAD-binding oxidoreductase [Legionella beliardensis]STX28026.1 phenol hydroxylase [Legionella beliardensis]
MQANLFPITLVEAFMLSPNVKHFIFKADKIPPFNYIPGQFITIHFESNGKLLRRSYSIANVPSQDNLIEFAAGYVEGGPGTDLLFNLAPGDSININGPFGRLVLKDELPKRYVLAATSTGITPYRAMITELKKRLTENPSLNVLIMLGVQKPEDALYEEEFLAFAMAYPQQVTFRVQLSRADNLNLQPNQFRGYIQHAFPEIALNPAEDVVYLCGNPGMIDECFEELKKRDFAMQQIIREKYISANTK